MNDDLEPRLHDWLAERGRVTDVQVRAVADRVTTLPARRRSSPWLPLAAAAAVVVAVVGLGTMLPRVVAPGGASASPSAAVALAPDPAAFAGDPRMVRCGVPPATAIYAFELPRARDYRSYLPRMGESPELDVDDPAFVVVFDGEHPFGAGGAVPRQPNQGGNRDVCMLVGGDPATATLNVYTNVDILDFDPTPVEARPTGVTATPTDLPPASPAVVQTLTPSPSTADATPPWSADEQLVCEGDVDVGVRDVPIYGADSVEEALQRFLAIAWYTASPARGYDAGERWGDLTAFRYRVDGVVKALVIIRDASRQSSHIVVESPSCPPDEFDPADGLTGSPGDWLDASGTPPSREILDERVDCYQGTLLRFEGRLFVRDPLGHAYDVAQLFTTYEHDGDLPADATDTGYRSGLRELHLAADELAAYIVIGDRVERWPRARGDDYGRTDCN